METWKSTRTSSLSGSDGSPVMASVGEGVFSVTPVAGEDSTGTPGSWSVTTMSSGWAPEVVVSREANRW